MIIWRIEDKAGRGPYRSVDTGGRLVPFHWADAASFTERHPSPLDDAKLSYQWRKLVSYKIQHLYSFGFSSEAQMLRWFYSNEAFEELHRYGFGVAQYDVPSEFCHDGNTQAVFCTEHAARLEWRPASEWVQEGHETGRGWVF